MLDQPLVLLDLETTGGNATSDRIIEIGLIEVHGGRVLREWSTLVDPQVRIPPWIEQFTGISNAMVAGAPSFAEIGPALHAQLAGKVLVAHNARFDYGFLKNEFRRQGLRYQAKVLCTVKLSRRLYPEHRHHNLDSLIERHGLPAAERHRALGDARVLWELLRVFQRERSPDELAAAVQMLLKTPSLPPGLDAEALEALPEGPGVYLFHGDNDAVLYVGKSVNLRERVLSHFSGDHRLNKDMRIAQQIRRVDWIETAGELGALLQEARLVKTLMPIHNQRLRRNRSLCAFQWEPGRAPQLVQAGELDFSRLDNLYGLFKSRRDALDCLRGLAEEHGLCQRHLGLEGGRGPCFAYQLKRCRGACVGEESAAAHDARLAAALARLRVQSWPFAGPVGLRERDAAGEREELHVLDAWCYLGTLRPGDALPDADTLRRQARFDLDTYTILTRYFAKHGRRLEIVELGAQRRVPPAA
ncbi:exonuclease domain-containing protein [Thermithiobacillus tepidarius DSM 3134]|uniref:exonuclease domain-containing protein n=1 Tax=Thermithiobacillus tepidarius TaxID=929 RepID=UPI0003FAA48E|nr:exonuclease domain-containing protein [Thermithiobacillus tepidarius]